MESKEKELLTLKGKVGSCKKCELWKRRNHPVFGEGNFGSRLMFIGEAPGYFEDQQGKPFVGRAGKVLDELLESVGLQREDIFITNVVKCRPPDNRNPLPDEIEACSSYLDEQLQLIQPQTIVLLGKFALSYIFEKFDLKQRKISEVHGKVFKVRDLMGIKRLIPLYHPATATYNPQIKEVLLKDFKSVKIGT
ncbi:MAG TPA: uracil-DNA glycosylase [Thermoplasmata archaeon]|nr:uracil-DNA glycosylase [Thermoplasmata archaeon]HIH97544.1 uracil-DNA glycosylase [Thermoplasmata archaeon]